MLPLVRLAGHPLKFRSPEVVNFTEFGENHPFR